MCCPLEVPSPTYAFHTLVVSNNTMFAKSAESGAATLHVWDVSKEAPVEGAGPGKATPKIFSIRGPRSTL